MDASPLRKHRHRGLGRRRDRRGRLARLRRCTLRALGRDAVAYLNADEITTGEDVQRRRGRSARPRARGATHNVDRRRSQPQQYRRLGHAPARTRPAAGATTNRSSRARHANHERQLRRPVRRPTTPPTTTSATRRRSGPGLRPSPGDRPTARGRRDAASPTRARSPTRSIPTARRYSKAGDNVAALAQANRIALDTSPLQNGGRAVCPGRAAFRRADCPPRAPDWTIGSIAAVRSARRGFCTVASGYGSVAFPAIAGARCMRAIHARRRRAVARR